MDNLLVLNNEVIKIDADNAQAVKQIINELSAKVDAAEAKIDAANDKHQLALDAKDAEIDALKAKLDSVEEQKLDSDAIANEINARLAVWSEFGKIDQIDPSLSVADATRKCLVLDNPKLAEKLDGKSDEYVKQYAEIMRELSAKPVEQAKQQIVADSKQEVVSSSNQEIRLDDIDAWNARAKKRNNKSKGNLLNINFGTKIN